MFHSHKVCGKYFSEVAREREALYSFAIYDIAHTSQSSEKKISLS
jgi:hypothetical protein